MTETHFFICPVCGYNKLPIEPYDAYGYPSYVICSCCGYEFGFDDTSKKITFELYRENWIKDGFKFFNEKKKPKVWNEEVLNQQLVNIKNSNYRPRI